MYFLLTQELDKLIAEEEDNALENGTTRPPDIGNPQITAEERERRAEAKRQNRMNNTFILALDGDVDFQPSALKLLIDRMKRNENVAAACGRIHPIGDGNI